MNIKNEEEMVCDYSVIFSREKGRERERERETERERERENDYINW